MSNSCTHSPLGLDGDGPTDALLAFIREQAHSYDADCPQFQDAARDFLVGIAPDFGMVYCLRCDDLFYLEEQE